MKIVCRAALLSLLLLLCCGESRAFPHIRFGSDHDSLGKRYAVSTSVSEKAMIMEYVLIQGDGLPPYSFDSTLALYHALPGSRDPDAASMVEMNAAVANLLKQKRYNEALASEEKIIAAFEAEHDTEGILITLETPGSIYDAAHDVEGRLRYYGPKADYFKRTGQVRNLATCYHKLAGYYVKKGNLNEAISHYLMAGELDKGFSQSFYANELYCAASFYKEWGNKERARYYFRLLHAQFGADALRSSALLSYYNLAEMDLEAGRFAPALRLLDTSSRYDKHNDTTLTLMIALKTAAVYIAQARLDTAGIILQRITPPADSLKLRIYSNHGFFELDYTTYLYHKARGERAAASASLEAAMAKAKLEGHNGLKQKYGQELMRWYSDKSPALALRYAQEYVALSDSIRVAAAPNNIAYYEHELEEAEANKSINALKEERQAQAIQLQSRKKILGRTYLALGLFAALALSLFYFNRRATKATRIIRAEKARSEALLLNILPAEVAEELKSNGASAARQYDEVSVLFTDFVDFTGTAEKLSPQQLVQELNECFTAFDAIIERNGLEKIKTIGDAYMAVCGLPASDPRHAQKTIQAAIEIRDFIEDRKKKERVFEIRIGINSGPVVAGIVGVKKFAYDIWGDTVNTAARMEQHGEAGRINISQSTHELIKSDYRCDYRGKIAAKNKGEVEMYFVEAAATEKRQ